MSEVEFGAKVRSLYAEGLDRLSNADCKQLIADSSPDTYTLDAPQCRALQQTLGWGAKGKIELFDKDSLIRAEFNREFIEELSGNNGKRSLEERVIWLNEFYLNSEGLKKKDKLKVIAELNDIGIEARAAMGALIVASTDEDDAIKMAAMEAIWRVLPTESKIIPYLIDGLKDTNPKVRCASAMSLGNIGQKAHNAVPHLTRLLSDPSAKVRMAAAYALGHLAKFAGKKSLLKLIPLLSDPESWRVREEAALALVSFHKRATIAVPALRNALNDPKARVRESAARALGAIGRSASDSLPDLAIALNDRNKWVRLAAIDAIRSIGVDDGDDVVMALIKPAMIDEDNKIQRSAYDTLWRMDYDTKVAVSEISSYLSSGDSQVRLRAVKLLGHMRSDSAEAVVYLIPLLDDPHEFIREATARTLGLIGAGAKPALPRLEELARNDSDRDTRQAAEDSIYNINNPYTGKYRSVMEALHSEF